MEGVWTLERVRSGKVSRVSKGEPDIYRCSFALLVQFYVDRLHLIFAIDGL